MRTGGEAPRGAAYETGFWFAPTVLADVNARHCHHAARRPSARSRPIVPIDSLDDALAIANDSRYGLSAYVFSRDYSAVMRTVDELQFGEIYVNRTLGESVHAHHAGLKESGIGGEDGKWGILEYTQSRPPTTGTAEHRGASSGAEQVCRRSGRAHRVGPHRAHGTAPTQLRPCATG